MPSFSNRLRLFGLLQDLQRQAGDLGLTRTAAALEVTIAVTMEELSDLGDSLDEMGDESGSAHDETD